VDPSGFVSTRHFPYEEGVDAQINDDTFSDSDDAIFSAWVAESNSLSAIGAYANYLGLAAANDVINGATGTAPSNAFQTGFSGSVGDAFAQGVDPAGDTLSAAGMSNTAAPLGLSSGDTAGSLDEVDVTAGDYQLDQVVVTAALDPPQFLQNVHIYLGHRGFNHMWWRHVVWPLPYVSRYASQYRNPNSLSNIFHETMQNAPGGIQQPNTRYAFTAYLGYNVGTDQNGDPTAYNTVIVQLLPDSLSNAQVITMFPGFPGQPAQ
jgi:hypothetical protein